MFNRLKMNLLVLISAVTLFTAALAAPAHLITKRFNSALDYACCRDEQLYIHHYYTKSILGFRLSDGFMPEKVNQKTTSGCNIQCTEE
jgi:hypothetical protein